MRVKTTVLAVALMLLTAACGDDDGGLPFGDTTTTTAATTTTTTTTAAATTTAPATTTTAAPATTATLGPPPLPQVQFLPGGIGFADFGDDPAVVLATAELLWGPPSTDSGLLPGGFGDYGVCPGTQFRQVFFLGDTVMLMFSDIDYFTGGGVLNFIHYSYSSPTNTPLTAGPPASIDVGSTVAQVQALWPSAVVVGDDPLYGPLFYEEGGPGFDYLFGTLTGVNPGDTVKYVSGGVGCGE